MKAKITSGKLKGVEFEVSKETIKDLERRNLEKPVDIGDIKVAFRGKEFSCPVALGINYEYGKEEGFEECKSFVILDEEDTQELINALKKILEN